MWCVIKKKGVKVIKVIIRVSSEKDCQLVLENLYDIKNRRVGSLGSKSNSKLFNKKTNMWEKTLLFSICPL